MPLYGLPMECVVLIEEGTVCRLEPFKDKYWTGFWTKNPVIVSGKPIALSGGTVYNVVDTHTKKRGTVAAYRLRPLKSLKEKVSLSEFL